MERVVRIVVLTSLLLLLIAGPARSQDTQHLWSDLPAISSFTSPAISHHPSVADGRLHAAAIAHSGLVAVTSTATPNAWSAWEILGPEPCPPLFCPAFYADPSTPPVFVSNDDDLYLFVRGADDNIHAIAKLGTAPWNDDWLPVTQDGRVKGRFSVVLARPTENTDPEIHLLYSTTGQRIEARHLNFLMVDVAPRKVWIGVIDGALGTDGEGQLMAVLRTPEPALLLETKVHPWTSAWQQEDVIWPEGDLGWFYDVSNVVYFAGAFHFMYAHRYQCGDIIPEYCHGINHAATIRGRPGYGPIASITEYVPDGTHHARSAIAVHRNRLVAAYSDAVGTHYLRQDCADPYLPWVGRAVLDPGQVTYSRPALAALDRRPYLSGADYAIANFGNDLFSAVSDAQSYQVSHMNLSRAVALRESTAQLSFWDSNERTDGNTCQHDSADATLIADPLTDGRPFFSEVGYDIWMLPDWLSSHIFKKAGRRGCLAGNTSGRFDPPCDETRYPVVIRPNNAIFVCSGAWVGRANDYLRIWEEFGHTLAGMLGFNDNGPLPTAEDSEETGIPIAFLDEGYAMFGESLGTSCPLGTDPDPPHAGRCRGFTGQGNNYDATSRQHSFMYVVYQYVYDGTRLRDWVARDLNLGLDLLQRKYAWTQEHIFHGVEFAENAMPLDSWNVDCAPRTQLTCGSTYVFDTTGGPNDIKRYPCTPHDYSGPEIVHALRIPVPALVTVEVDGLSADLDLMLVQPADTACNTDACVASSIAGSTAAESLTFESFPDTTHYLVVDGFSVTGSPYTLTVSCETHAPGTVPGEGSPLLLSRVPHQGNLELQWAHACEESGDYAVYRGYIGEWYSHEAAQCSTERSTHASLPMLETDDYFLVVSRTAAAEGSLGTTSSGSERPPATATCTAAFDTGACP